MKFHTIAVACLAASLPAFAQNADPNPDNPAGDSAEAVYAEKSAPQKTSRALVEEARDAFLRNAGLQLGAQGNPAGAYIGWGSSSVAVPLGSPAWGRARVAAFDNALIDARAEFIRFQFSDVLTESTRKIFEDDSYGLPEEPASDPGETRGKLRAMFSKILAIGDAKLNAKLQDIGMDPSDFDPPPSVSREDHYTNQLLQNTVTRSYGSLAGLVPLQTFEGNDDKGNYTIGVLVVYSDSFRQFASDVLEGRGKLRSNKAGRSLAQQLGNDPSVFSSQFGVRRFYSEEGLPALVSFGQFAVIDRGGSDRAMDRRRQSALTIARSNADAAIALFLNGNLMFNNSVTTGQIIEEYTETEKSKDGVFSTLNENVGFISRLNEEIKQRAQVQLSGLTDYTTWTYTHPDADQELVGVVRVWSPDTFKAAQDLRNFTPDTGDKDPAATEPDAGPAKVKQGGMPVDVSDF